MVQTLQDACMFRYVSSTWEKCDMIVWLPGQGLQLVGQASVATATLGSAQADGGSRPGWPAGRLMACLG